MCHNMKKGLNKFLVSLTTRLTALPTNMEDLNAILYHLVFLTSNFQCILKGTVVEETTRENGHRKTQRKMVICLQN